MSVSPLVQGFVSAFGQDACLGVGGPQLHEHRQRMLARFAALGLPTRRDERWRYTELGALARRQYAAPGTPGAAASPALPGLDALRVSLRDGSAQLPDALPAGLRLTALRDLDPAALTDWEPDTDDAWVALNAALGRDGLLVEVEAGADIALPLLIDQQLSAAAAPRAVQSRVFVALGAGARLSLIEHHGAAAGQLVNAVTRLRLAPGARLGLARIQDQDRASHHLGMTEATLEADAELTLSSCQLGAQLARHAAELRLLGPRARCVTRALNLGTGRQQHDLRVAVEHLADHTRSEQTYRGVVDGHARAACVSRVLVGPGTRGCDARQALRSLLLSAQAEADQKPELEIHSHEVAAQHGATIGQLDEEALFYLLSRGLDPDQARALLVFAFADEALLGLAPALRAHLEARIGADLPGPAALEQPA
jgi:Fe-S cluster assembly protein SufD